MDNTQGLIQVPAANIRMRREVELVGGSGPHGPAHIQPGDSGIEVLRREPRTGFLDYVKRRNRTPNPIVPGKIGIFNWTLYDTITAAQAATTAVLLQAFTVPAGTSGKTKLDTNLEQVSRIPGPGIFNAVSVGFYFSSRMLKEDIDDFLDSYYMEFVVVSRIYAEGLLMFYPAGAGLAGMTTKTAEGGWSNGQPNVANFYDLRLPAGLDLGGGTFTDGYTGITILQDQTFRVDLKATTGVTLNTTAAGGFGLRLIVALSGQMTRGVQE